MDWSDLLRTLFMALADLHLSQRRPNRFKPQPPLRSARAYYFCRGHYFLLFNRTTYSPRSLAGMAHTISDSACGIRCCRRALMEYCGCTRTASRDLCSRHRPTAHNCGGGNFRPRADASNAGRGLSRQLFGSRARKRCSGPRISTLERFGARLWIWY